MTKPAAVRAVTAIAWIRIAFAILLLALTAPRRPQPTRILAGARAGLLADAGAGTRSGFDRPGSRRRRFAPS